MLWNGWFFFSKNHKFISTRYEKKNWSSISMCWEVYNVATASCNWSQFTRQASHFYCDPAFIHFPLSFPSFKSPTIEFCRSEENDKQLFRLFANFKQKRLLCHSTMMMTLKMILLLIEPFLRFVNNLVWSNKRIIIRFAPFWSQNRRPLCDKPTFTLPISCRKASQSVEKCRKVSKSVEKCRNVVKTEVTTGLNEKSSYYWNWYF